VPTIFVPSRFKRRVLKTTKKATVVSKEIWGQCRGIPVKGYFIELPRLHYAATYFPLLDIHENFHTECKQESATCVTPVTQTERRGLAKRFEFKLNHPFDMDIAHKDLAQFKDAITMMRHYIEPILLTTKYKVTLHLRTLPGFEPFYDEDHLHIVIGSAPPGCTTKQSITDPSLLLHMGRPEDEYYTGPTKHRGTVVRSDEDSYDGQIIGSTLYIFLPLTGNLLELYGSREGNPFQKRLASVWKVFLESKEQPPPLDCSRIEKDEFTKRVTEAGVHHILLAEIEREIADAQAEAEKLQNMLTLVLTELRTKIIFRDSLASRSSDSYIPQADGLWELVSHHPLIEHIDTSDENRIIYHTRPVHIEDDEGNLRNVGTFAVMADDFKIYVWSTGTTHPKRVAHPHIASHENSICYGNISTEIADLCSKDRHTEAILLVLRWLTEGYEPSLTYHRIEEWPLVKNEESNDA
jgi:hypothetical protein